VQAIDLDINLLDKAIDRMMPELGFGPDDNDRERAFAALHFFAQSVMPLFTLPAGPQLTKIMRWFAASSWLHLAPQ